MPPTRRLTSALEAVKLGFVDNEAFDETMSNPSHWLLDRELDVAAEVYGPEPVGLHTPSDELSDAELVQRFIQVNGFDLHLE